MYFTTTFPKLEFDTSLPDDDSSHSLTFEDHDYYKSPFVSPKSSTKHVKKEHDYSYGKVFVGGLAPSVTQETLRAYCQKYGAIADAVVMMDKITHRSRGFGFVTFMDSASVDLLMSDKSQEHLIDDKKVQFKRAVPTSFMYNPEKIFVGGIPPSCDNDKLRNHFSKYGTVIDAQVMYDKTTGRSRGFGYVNFEASEAVEAVLEVFDKHNIDGKWVEVKRCLPNEARKGGALGKPNGGLRQQQPQFPVFSGFPNQTVMNAYATQLAMMNPFTLGAAPFSFKQEMVKREASSSSTDDEEGDAVREQELQRLHMLMESMDESTDAMSD